MGDKTKVSDILEELELLQKLKDAEITRLKSELERVKKIAKRVCKFYGDKENWMFSAEYGTPAVRTEIKNDHDCLIGCSGKLARECEKELEALGVNMTTKKKKLQQIRQR